MGLYFLGSSPQTYYNCPLHTHACAEIILNLDGEGDAASGDTETTFCPGTIQVIPPGTPHGKHAAGGFRDIFLHCDAKDLILENGTCLYDAAPVLCDDPDQTLRQLMEVMLTRFLKGNKNDMILVSLYHTVLQFLKEQTAACTSDSAVSSVLHRIHASFNDPEFRVTEALAASGYQIDHIRRRFTAVCGKTPNEYLTGLRINYAKQLLCENNVLHFSIGEVALRSGFYDQRYFSRQFRKITGAAPSDWAAGT